MKITREESQKLYDQYMPRVKNAVERFRGKRHFEDWEYPDVLQVAWLAFYDHVDRLENLDHLRTTCYNAIFSRLFYYHEDKSMIDIPHQDYEKEIGNFTRLSMEDIPEERYAVEMVDPVVIADKNRFIETLTAEQRRIVELKLQGRTHQEIAEQMGGSIDRHYRQLRKIRAKYKKYFQMDQGDKEV